LIVVSTINKHAAGLRRCPLLRRFRNMRQVKDLERIPLAQEML
jgi:hypothetical protein